jgi:hypothetical protein
VLSRLFWITQVSGYLNTPATTETKKINTVAKSNPATIFFLSATPRRAAGLRRCRRGSNLEGRNFYYGAYHPAWLFGPRTYRTCLRDPIAGSYGSYLRQGLRRWCRSLSRAHHPQWRRIAFGLQYA